MSVINREELPFVGASREFVGEKHDVNISFFLVNAPPGASPKFVTEWLGENRRQKNAKSN